MRSKRNFVIMIAARSFFLLLSSSALVPAQTTWQLPVPIAVSKTPFCERRIPGPGFRVRRTESATCRVTPSTFPATDTCAKAESPPRARQAVLYQVIREHLPGFLQTIESDGSRSPLPHLVVRELRAFRE